MSNSGLYFSHPDGITDLIVLSPEWCHGNLPPADAMGLLERWEALNESGRTIDEGVIRRMARTHKVLGGKWMLYPRSLVAADVFWSIIAPAVVYGQLTTSCVGAKVMPRGLNNKTTICVYIKDFTEFEKVEELENAIRTLKFKCDMRFKADVYSKLGIFGTNCHDYNVCSHLYKSVFNLRLGTSFIIHKTRWNECSLHCILIQLSIDRSHL